MTVLLLGSGGQLGTALQAAKPQSATLIARDYPDIDLGDAAAIEALVAATAPELILNAAAYTAVDKAETETELAFRINGAGVGALAHAAQKAEARLIHISTDYVFDGTKGHPYRPDDPPSPKSAYGKSKLEGEKAALAACQNCLILRTAWLYHEVGANFVKTMLRLMATRPEIRVVSDQVGTPTYAGSLAEALWALAETDHRGILHFTDSGVASWYDFACAIQEEAIGMGLLEKPVPVLPISTAEYPLPAPRPVFGILDKSETWALLGKPAAHWRDNLRLMLKRMKNG